MLITLNGSNISYKIGKNPNSPPKIMHIRQGYSIGWFNGDEYCVRFIDAPDEISYPDYVDQTYEYLSESKYNSPLCALNLMDYFKVASKYDTIDMYKMECFHLRIKERTLKTIQKYWPGFVTFEKLKYWDNYKVTIEKNCTLAELIAFAEVLFLLITIDNHENIYIDDSLVEKAVKKLRMIDAPYFIRYIFKCILISKNKFDKYKDDINYGSEKYDISCYDNYTSRFVWVDDRVKNSVVDVGCGEGRYSKIARRVPFYYGIEPDEHSLFKAKRRCQEKGILNVEFYSSLEEFLENKPDGPLDVICSEVIEHLNIEAVPQFVQSLKFPGVERVLITTPNSNFNKFYDIELRHDDHKWEGTPEEIMKLTGATSFEFIGDKVNDIGTTVGVIL